MKKLLDNKKRIIIIVTILTLMFISSLSVYVLHYFYLVNKVSIMGASNDLEKQQLACDISEQNKIIYNYLFKFVADTKKLNIAKAYTSYPELASHAVAIVKTIKRTQDNEFSICNIFYYSYNAYNMENLEEAKLCYSKLIKEHPTNPEYYLARAKVQSNSQSAIEDNERGIKLLTADKTYPDKDKKFEEAYCNLFINNLGLGDVNEKNIIDAGYMCISYRTNNRNIGKYSSLNANMYETMGNIYRENGKLSKAQDMYYNAVISEPFNKEYQRAMLYTFPFGDYEGTAYLYNAVCLEEESYLACDKAAKYNQDIGTNLSIVGYKIMGDIDLEMKNYKSALINYEKAKNYNDIYNQDTIDLINRKIEDTKKQASESKN